MTEFRIDLYPGDQALEGIVADFTVEPDDHDPHLRELPGYWATLEGVQLGGCWIGRDMVQLMVGAEAVTKIESDVSERINNAPSEQIAAE